MTDFIERVWVPPHRTDLGETLSSLQHGPWDPTFQWLSRGTDALLTRRFDGRSATLRLTTLPDNMLRARAWGDGAETAIARAPEFCGANDNSAAFTPILPEVAAAHRRRDGMRIPRSGTVFTELVPAVLEQKVIVEQATASYRRLVLRYGEPAPGPLPRDLAARMRVSPTAETWRRIPSWTWHRAGVDPARSRTVVQLAARASAIDRLAALPAPEARARLETLAGVGAWTSAEVAQRALGDADAVSVGDYHLRKHIGYALEGRDFTDTEMLAALEPWRGQRYRAVRLILSAGPNRPRRGPRLEKVDYRAF
ncbi:MAG: DNA-3-methyladenine glycosylase family protein [Gulosibacter sp.]|uniref:DNA-3-methyladenine glycosylase family protein n=1 Tax=Gulosibacter sp. TaxID=2817531 RepID=UPI003F8EEC7B